jgi:hypothetical protein
VPASRRGQFASFFQFSFAVFTINLASKYPEACHLPGFRSNTEYEERRMSNRRKETRRRFTAFTPVYDLHPRVLLGYLGDLSLLGALVIGTNLTTIKKETELEIQFPGEILDLPVLPVKIPARIAWCRPDENPQYFNIGVEFTEMTPEHEELFQQILVRYHFQHALSDADFDQE